MAKRRYGITEFSGQSCLVTGAASGIGRAAARQLGAEGAHLVLTDLRAEPLAEAVAEIEAAGGTVLHSAALDITDYEAVGQLAADVHSDHGAVDAIFHVAGISAWGTVSTLEHKHWRSMVDVNLMGPIHVIEHFVPAMVEAGRGGALAIVSSAAGLIGLPWHAAYSAAKFGVRGINEVLRFDLRRYGISVHTVCPGAVDTPLVRTVEITGVDMTDPAVEKTVGRFRRHAASPQAAARSMIDGVRKRRHIIYTSFDIRLAFWAQRYFPPGYNAAMRLLNWKISALADKSTARAAKQLARR